MGHVIPDYETLLEKGLENIKKEMQGNVKGATPAERDFLQACILTFEGLQKYIRNYAFYAGYLLEDKNRIRFGLSDAHCETLKEVNVKN